MVAIASVADRRNERKYSLIRPLWLEVMVEAEV